MAKLKPCPIKGCTSKWRLLRGLGAHLFIYHNKSELIDYILKAEAELARLEEVEKH